MYLLWSVIQYQRLVEFNIPFFKHLTLSISDPLKEQYQSKTFEVNLSYLEFLL